MKVSDEILRIAEDTRISLPKTTWMAGKTTTCHRTTEWHVNEWTVKVRSFYKA